MLGLHDHQLCALAREKNIEMRCHHRPGKPGYHQIEITTKGLYLVKLKNKAILSRVSMIAEINQSLLVPYEYLHVHGDETEAAEESELEDSEIKHEENYPSDAAPEDAPTETRKRKDK
jgi:hypothetical protein